MMQPYLPRGVSPAINCLCYKARTERHPRVRLKILATKIVVCSNSIVTSFNLSTDFFLRCVFLSNFSLVLLCCDCYCVLVAKYRLVWGPLCIIIQSIYKMHLVFHLENKIPNYNFNAFYCSICTVKRNNRNLRSKVSFNRTVLKCLWPRCKWLFTLYTFVDQEMFP